MTTHHLRIAVLFHEHIVFDSCYDPKHFDRLRIGREIEVPTASALEGQTLFSTERGEVILTLPPGLEHTLRVAGHADPASASTLPLAPGDWGSLVFGEVRVLFQFVLPPARVLHRTGMGGMRGVMTGVIAGMLSLLGAGVLFSLLAQGGFVFYAYYTYDPEREALEQIVDDDRWVEVLAQREPEPEEEEPEPEPEPEPEEEDEELEPEPEPEPKPEPPAQAQVLAAPGADSALVLAAGSQAVSTPGAIRGSREGRGSRVEKPRKPKPKAEKKPKKKGRKPMRLDQVKSPPKLVKQEPRLGYPKALKAKAIQGKVVVQCIITEKGKVRACRHRQGHQELGRYVMSVVKGWRFEPARDGKNRPVAVAYTFRVPFKLR